MGSTSYITKPKSAAYRMKSGSSAGSDKEMGGKLKRTKIRRPNKLNEYGLKRIPDYTELAYKEAVSKLRYFLSGNYSPSVRSYGGSASVKNLDESDGDIDKKYTSSYLAEYKPRPRLTAKYATLYADSLNNYTPQHTASVSAPPAAHTGVSSADVTGGTNPDVVHFIQKQEEYIEQLERESQYCRDELNNLLGKVKEVISENEHLHEAQKNKLISRMFHSYNGSESDDLDELGDSTGLDSDNKVTPSKGRKSTKSRFTKLEGPNIVFESRIAELEAQLTQAKIDLKKVQDENNENKRKLASGLVDSTCLDGFKRQIDNLQRDKSTLEAQISKLKLNLDQKDDDGSRYKRGSDAVENQLREERNNLEIEIRRLKDELSKERNKVRELAGEGARRAIQERSAAEQRYNAHFDELQHDLAAQYDNVAKLQLDLERQRREENELKREISMKNSAIDELRMELKNKMSSLQADLAQAHAEKASLEEELASARLAMERQQRQAKHETNRLNSEIQSLRQRLDRADADLVHSRRENLRLSEQIANLEKEQTMKNLTPISPVKNKTEKSNELSNVLESMENKHAKTVAELESMIHSQNSLMEKLTGECRLLTDKLDDANRRHKQELATLQRQVNGLSISLQSPHQPSHYQAHPTHATTPDRDAERTPSDSGREHPGAEPPGYSQDKFVRSNSTLPTSDRNGTNKFTGLNEPDLNYETENMEENETKVQGQYETSNYEEIEQESDVKMDQEIPMEHSQAQEYDNSNYQYEQDYEQGQHQQAVDSEYQNQPDQHFEQPEQHFENYEQYPDPNAQYDQQYDNYPQEKNYEEEQGYVTSGQEVEYQASHNSEHLPVQSHSDDINMQQEHYDTTQHPQDYQLDESVSETKNENVAKQNGTRKLQNTTLPDNS